MEKVVEQVRNATGIQSHPRDVGKILACISETTDFWRILYLSNRPFNIVAETIKTLAEDGLLRIDENNKIHLTDKGQAFLQDHHILPKKDCTCPKCQGRGVSNDEFSNLLVQFREVSRQRPKAVIEYDQGFVTDETTVARVALLADRGDIQGKDILIIGDDDLVSLAAAMSGLSRRVVVLEVDRRLIDFIQQVAAEHNLPIEARSYDVKYRLPEEYVGAFDTFLTDPPETIGGLRVFLRRGLASLKGPGCAAYFGLTYTESSLYKWNTFQQMLTRDFQVAITDIIHNFNEYVTWDYLLGSIRDDLSFVQVKPEFNWYRSSMYRIETLAAYKGPNEDVQEEELYVDEEALVFTKGFGREKDE